MTSDDLLYASVDSVIERWAGENSLKLFRSVADRDARFVYLSSSKGECFQISVEPPNGGFIKVHAWTIETLDDREMHEEWVSSVAELYGALQNALAIVRGW